MRSTAMLTFPCEATSARTQAAVSVKPMSFIWVSCAAYVSSGFATGVGAAGAGAGAVADELGGDEEDEDDDDGVAADAGGGTAAAAAAAAQGLLAPAAPPPRPSNAEKSRPPAAGGGAPAWCGICRWQYPSRSGRG